MPSLPWKLPFRSRGYESVDLPADSPYLLGPGIPAPGAPSLLRHPFGNNVLARGRIVYLLSIDYAFRPRLRSRLTLGGSTFPRNPWASGERDSHAFLATHADILTSLQSTRPCRSHFTPQGTLPYQSRTYVRESEASALCLAPYICGAEVLDQ